MHGLSLNVSENLDGFSLIHPCGFNDIEITSVEQELARRDTVPPLFSEIKSLIVHEFCETFGYGRKK
jgi:lipoyl(octanoyl) transferase